MRSLVLAIAAVLGAGGLAVAGPAAVKTPKPLTVTVTATDFRFKLSRQRLPKGQVRFVVVNRGATPHDFRLAGRRTPVLKPGGRAVLALNLRKAGRLTYVCTLPGHAALGMKGTLDVGPVTPGSKPQPPAEPPPAPAPPPSAGALASLTATGTFSRPVFVTSPPGDERRLFVVEVRGTIRVLVDGIVQAQPFLDISERVREGAENGLLSMAFCARLRDERPLLRLLHRPRGQ